MLDKKTRRRLILCGAVFGFVVYALGTGGLVLSKSRDFGGQRDVTMVAGLQSDFWLEPRFIRWGIPVLFHSSSSRGPWGLRIQIWDESESYRALELSEVRVAHPDGNTTRTPMRWKREFGPYTRHNRSAGELVKTELMMLSETLPEVVTRHEYATVTVTGKLHKTDGTEISFSTSEKFTAQSDLYLTTWWEVMAGV